MLAAHASRIALAYIIIGISIALPCGRASFASGDSLPKDGEIVEVIPDRPGHRTYFVNGMNTDARRAMDQARAVAQALGTGMRLAFVDCSIPERDLIAVVMSKAGDLATELNPAADALADAIEQDARAGYRVTIIAYSLGGAVTQNAINGLKRRLPQAERHELLRRISILLVGAACFGLDHALSDGFPSGLGGLFSISDARDPVARMWGDVDDTWLPEDRSRHALTAYLPHLSIDRTGQKGRLVVDGPDMLVEVVTHAVQPKDRVIRWRVRRIEGQSSRTTLNASPPRDWETIAWAIRCARHGVSVDPTVRLTPMMDNPFWPDDAAGPPIRDGASTRHTGTIDYLGRYQGPTDLLDSGLVVEARPQR